MRMDVREIHTVVVGSGAAGLNATDRLFQYGVRDLALVTENMNWGTSRNTGSDKQTYYKLSLAGDAPDSVRKLAQVLYDGGCVDGEHALCEAALSCQGFFKLVELGVPFPHNVYGEYVGYKTDHDPNDRGTSVGPYTSRYMTEKLEQAVREKKIEILDHHQVIRILSDGEKLFGILCMNTENGAHLLIRCTNLVYATGGPAGIYGQSVYPVSQHGASGLAFEAGVKGKNLTEWQYGLASLHPRWNVSGSYMQVLPRFVSTDQSGDDPQEFLLDYYPDTKAAMNMIFLKGYQWPFDARKVADGSSMVDLLVYREIFVKGRRVWLDYRDNCGGKEVDFQGLSEECRTYLERAGACQETPIERLWQLNPLAVDFYKEHGVDLAHEMLEVAVCAQHNNGGLAVDGWWQTNIRGIFAVGEAAATHGIYRPGGSALNSGQVGSTRAAQYIAAHKEEKRSWSQEEMERLLRLADERICLGQWAAEKNSGYWKEQEKKAAMQMSQAAAMLRDPEAIEEMLEEICAEREQWQDRKAAQTVTVPDGWTEEAAWYRYYDQRLCQQMYLSAMKEYCLSGGKSRGSAIYQDENGAVTIPNLVRFSLDGEDGLAHQEQIQEIWLCPSGTCEAKMRLRHPLGEIPAPGAFETEWSAYRNKSIYEG